jgi:hypothetical protein
LRAGNIEWALTGIPNTTISGVDHMTYLWWILPVLQIYFAIHAYRNGNYFWIFIIVFFPGVGVIIYLFAEYVPSLRNKTGFASGSNSIIKRLMPSREIERLKDEVSMNNSINNRLALANCYLDLNQAENAIRIFENCLEGAYKNDPHILLSLSKAYYRNKNYTAALDKLLLIRKDHPTFIDKGVSALIAKSYDELGQMDKAIREYENIVNISTGEEIRCRYALALRKTGQSSEAAKVFETIIRKAKVSPNYYKSSEKEWIKIAKSSLESIKSASTGK